MMNAQERKNAISQLLLTTSPCMTGIPIMYHGERKTFNAYQIPLDYLTYNKLNGRIGSVVKSFERQDHELDCDNPEDVKLIERFLWESKEDANKKTRKSLLDEHQKQYGIVTAEGVIIDGNRRACLLNSLRRDESIDPSIKQHCNFFVAIVLPIDADRKEILRLETTFQMGIDEKVDYNPIEKYLKCKDLRDADFSEREIASFMGDSETNIRMYLGVLSLMDEYLDTYGYNGIYTILDKNKNEDSFQKLYQALKAYQAGGVSMWDYDPETDVSDLKLIAFDYIRMGFDQTEFRDIITKPTSSNPNRSFFGCKDIWEAFRDQHFNDVESIEEDSISDIIASTPDGDITRKLISRDNRWKKLVEDKIKANYGRNSEKLRNKQAADSPLKLLQKAADALSCVDTNQPNFAFDDDIKDCVIQLGKMIWEFKKIIEKNGK